jgi:hypothetical protein
MLFFFLVDSTEWQQTSALWHQDMMDMHLNEVMGTMDYEKLGKTFVMFLGVHSLSIVDSIAIVL